LGPPVYQGDSLAAQYTAQFTGSFHDLFVIALTAPTKNRNTFHSVAFGLDHPIISKEVLSQLNFRKIVHLQKSFCLLPEKLVDFQVQNSTFPQPAPCIPCNGPIEDQGVPIRDE